MDITGSDKRNPMTVDDSYQFGLNSLDVEKTSTPETKTPLRMGPGSGFDSDTIHSIRAVTAVNAGPNVLVATNKTGQLPVGTMPGVSGSFVYGGQTFTLVNGVVTSIV